MEFIKASNLALRFLLEVVTLIAFGYWGIKTGKGIFFKTILGIGVPLFIMIIWGTFGSPAAPYKLGTFGTLFLEIIIYGSATMAMFSILKPIFAIWLMVIVLINKILMLLWGQ